MQLCRRIFGAVVGGEGEGKEGASRWVYVCSNAIIYVIRKTKKKKRPSHFSAILVPIGCCTS